MGMSCIKLNSNFKLQKDDKSNVIPTRSHFNLKKLIKNYYFIFMVGMEANIKIKKQKTLTVVRVMFKCKLKIGKWLFSIQARPAIINADRENSSTKTHWQWVGANP